MPKHPNVTPSLAAVRQSVFTTLAKRLAAFEGEIYPLHIGDTWMPPAAGCRMEDVHTADHPGVNRYAKVQGTDGLVDAIVERTRAAQGCPTERDAVLVSAGATGGLGAIVGAITSPGDEVLILAPYWPLFAGIVRSFHATPVPVPFIGVVHSPESAAEAVRAKLTERTVALYVSTPRTSISPTAHPSATKGSRSALGGSPRSVPECPSSGGVCVKAVQGGAPARGLQRLAWQRPRLSCRSLLPGFDSRFFHRIVGCVEVL